MPNPCTCTYDNPDYNCETHSVECPTCQGKGITKLGVSCLDCAGRGRRSTIREAVVAPSSSRGVTITAFTCKCGLSAFWTDQNKKTAQTCMTCGHTRVPSQREVFDDGVGGQYVL